MTENCGPAFFRVTGNPVIIGKVSFKGRRNPPAKMKAISEHAFGEKPSRTPEGLPPGPKSGVRL